MAVLTVNGVKREIDIDPSTPLLWAIREQLGLTGTKFGCGISQCGACTIRLNGNAIRSCVTPVAAADGQDIQTIEGLAADDGTRHRLQTAWIKHQVPQCGYCQSGQLMSAAALLESNPNPTDDDIDTAMDGNICRCGMYGRIKAAIKTAAKAGSDRATSDATDDATNEGGVR
ncbi:MAG: (2Fe-2S)-binding protein [Vicinamibacterales bacterium]|nr:(2Fe-2S)-binding protein [Vicinamibacterales bacterium]